MKSKIIILSILLLVLSACKQSSSNEPETSETITVIKKQEYVLVSQYQEINPLDYVEFTSSTRGNINQEITVDPLDTSLPTTQLINYSLQAQSTSIYFIIYPPNNQIDASTIDAQLVRNPEAIDAFVNRYYTLSSDYIPNDLIYFNNYQMRQVILEPYKQLLNEASTAGFNFYILSAYRSYQYQDQIYHNYIHQVGLEKAITFSAYPGRSEHQTGLVLDIGCTDAEDFSTNLGNAPSGIWLSENAHRFGFIVRFPLGKEEITGYQYEPWHIRYLGVELATTLYENNLTYEEYMLSLNPSGGYVNGNR